MMTPEHLITLSTADNTTGCTVTPKNKGQTSMFELPPLSVSGRKVEGSQVPLVKIKKETKLVLPAIKVNRNKNYFLKESAIKKVKHSRPFY